MGFELSPVKACSALLTTLQFSAVHEGAGARPSGTLMNASAENPNEPLRFSMQRLAAHEPIVTLLLRRRRSGLWKAAWSGAPFAGRTDAGSPAPLQWWGIVPTLATYAF